jgi:hypothetical protein
MTGQDPANGRFGPGNRCAAGKRNRANGTLVQKSALKHIGPDDGCAWLAATRDDPDAPMSERVKCHIELMNRALGKIKENVEVSGNTGLSLEERIALLRAADAIRRERDAGNSNPASD